MTKTPWGNTEDFQARKLRPGSRTPRDEVKRSQRERLFGAMVSAVSERGYEATRVSDLVALSGVSRSAFYDHFEDKQQCFMATMEAALEGMMGLLATKYDGKGSAFHSFIEIIVEQPAAARMCFLETYPAGSPATALMDGAVAGVEELYRRGFAARNDGLEMPDQIVRAIVGGLRRVIYSHLLRGTESQLTSLAPELWTASIGYQPPPKPLRPRRSRRQASQSSLSADGEPADRILSATSSVIAEKGYARATIGEIVEHAGVSLTTFYSNFESKDAAMWAALDTGQARLFATALPVYRRARSQGWPQAVRLGCESMLRFFSSEPDFARLGIIESYNAGPRAMEARNRSLESLQPLLEDGYQLSPQASPVLRDLIPATVSALIYNELRAHGPEALPRASALASYLILAPFLGAEEACAVARAESGTPADEAISERS